MAYTEAQKKAQLKYQATLKEVKFRVKPEEYERISTAAEHAGKSVRAFCLDAINEEIMKEEKKH